MIPQRPADSVALDRSARGHATGPPPAATADDGHDFGAVLGSPAEQLTLYRQLLLARLAEEKIRDEYFNDEMKTPIHLGIGGEAIGVGVLHALPRGSSVFGTYRNHTIYLTLSDDSDGFFGELYGRVTGCAAGKAGSMHMCCPEHGLFLTSAVVGTTIPVAVGAALANAYRGSDDVVAVFFGDGAVEEGVFWESLNFACLHRLRVLFVCEDNGLAIHTGHDERRGFDALLKVVDGYRCHHARADGRQLGDVVAAAQQTLDTMHVRGGPGVLHLDYTRFLQHVGPLEDFSAGYRSAPVDLNDKHDPVALFEARLRASGVDDDTLAGIRGHVAAKLEASVQRAKAAPFPPRTALADNVYAPAAQ